MKYIIDYIVVFFDFVKDLFTSIGNMLWNVLQIVIKGFDFLFSVISALPTILTVCAIGIVVVCVIYKVLGRGDQEAS